MVPVLIASDERQAELLRLGGRSARAFGETDRVRAAALFVTDEAERIPDLARRARDVDGAVLAITDRPAAALAAGASFVTPDTETWIAAAIASGIRDIRERRTPAPRERRAGGRASDARAKAMIAAAITRDSALTLLHVRLARLDLVNVAHGRHAGTALVAAAERRITALVTSLSDEDGLVARVDGPGFVIALPGSPDAAIIAAVRLEEALARPFRVDDTAITLGSRIGIAGAQEGDDAASLLARAAANAAEPAGEGAPVPTLLPETEETPIETLAADLHHALARGEIRVLFQPQADIATGRITGVEALARWQHPRLGALGAATLFAASERAEIGLALSEHIQGLVVDRASHWPVALHRLRVSLNLTAADLARPRFVEQFLGRVDASGFPRGRLTLEITETGLMADLDAAAALLAELRGAGCRIAIDDFGTGYSSLAYLKALPIDYIKLDKSLVKDVDGSSRDRVVVAGTIDMARSLGLTVIAEGVETEAQRSRLAADGCNLYQGFLLAEPLDEAALVPLIEGDRP